MPKTPSNKLFRLIKSLTGSEKRYFKLFVRQGGTKTNKYIQLFDAIDEQEYFDDAALQKLIYAGKPVESRKYSELKAYLYDLILKSLQFYDEKHSVDFRIKNMLQSIQVLYKRSLFEDCRELLKKARKLSYKYEKYNAILEILNWDKKVAYAKSDIDFLNRELKNIEEEEKFCTHQLDTIQRYRNLFLHMLLGIRKYALRNSEWSEQLRKQILQLEQLNIDSLASHRAKVLHFRILSVYYYSLRNDQEFYTRSKALVALMESNVLLLREDLSDYISALSNLSMSCGKLKKYEEVEECLAKLRALEPNNLDDELKIHRQYYTNLFRLCIIKGAFKKGVRALETHFAELDKFDEQLFERNSFYFQYFYLYFGVGDYDMALENLNKWLNLPKTVDRQDLQGVARILNLIIHYEMGNTLLLDSLLRSTYRFLNRQNNMYLFERKMVQFIRDANKIQGKENLRKAFKELKQSFKGMKLVRTEKAMLQLFDIEAWLDSKIEQKPFAQMVKDKYEKSRMANLAN